MRSKLFSGVDSALQPPSASAPHCALAAARAALPADAAICVAAVSDWRPDEVFGIKLKKGREGPPALTLVENPDILATLSATGPKRPKLVVGFAAAWAGVKLSTQTQKV